MSYLLDLMERLEDQNDFEAWESFSNMCSEAFSQKYTNQHMMKITRRVGYDVTGEWAAIIYHRFRRCSGELTPEILEMLFCAYIEPIKHEL